MTAFKCGSEACVLRKTKDLLDFFQKNCSGGSGILVLITVFQEVRLMKTWFYPAFYGYIKRKAENAKKRSVEEE